MEGNTKSRETTSSLQGTFMVKERKSARVSRAGKFWKTRGWKRRARVERSHGGRR